MKFNLGIFLNVWSNIMYKTFSSELLWFPGRSLRDDLPLAVKYGYEGISFDIKNESSGFSPEEFSLLLEKNKLRPGNFALPVEFRKDRETFEADLELLKPCAVFAQKTGVTRCVTYIMSYSDTLDYKSNFRQHKERLTQVAGILEEHGIRFGLEFLGPPTLYTGKAFKFIHNLDGLTELLDAIGTTNTGYLLDLFHWEMAGQVFEDFKKISKKEQVVVAHLSDAPKGMGREEQPNHMRELPGATGVFKTNEFFKGLENLNYDGPVLVEPFNHYLKTLNFEDAVKAAKTALDAVWPK